ncbi:hypothetical protein V0R55_24660 [Pseudomonas soli]|uniref:DUF3077 domain-containing protein n=1 Tax=Pseudomonas soli TaxID=1306993 RepID=A0ABU7GWK9_9PSED|nr:hypothetical protein [Pseudomonas soli]MEE1883360.1 hypothetical protein [Pseudomonas soli]
MTCSCPTGDGSLRFPCLIHPDDAVSPAPRLVSQLEGLVLRDLCQFEIDAQRLGGALRALVDVDQHAVERGLIALQRATEQLKKAVMRNEVCSEQ